MPNSPHLIQSVTRASSRGEFPEAEFNGIGVRFPYIGIKASASVAASTCGERRS
jgi:hypothetical protein